MIARRMELRGVDQQEMVAADTYRLMPVMFLMVKYVLCALPKTSALTRCPVLSIS